MFRENCCTVAMKDCLSLITCPFYVLSPPPCVLHFQSHIFFSCLSLSLGLSVWPLNVYVEEQEEEEEEVKEKTYFLE